MATLNLDLNRAAPGVLDSVGALALLLARSYAVWALWTLYVAPALWPWARVDFVVVVAALVLVAVWRGAVSWPPAAAAGSLKAAAIYGAIGLGAAWWAGAVKVPVAAALEPFEVHADEVSEPEPEVAP